MRSSFLVAFDAHPAVRRDGFTQEFLDSLAQVDFDGWHICRPAVKLRVRPQIPGLIR